MYTLCLASGILKTVIKHFTTVDNYQDFNRSLDSALQLQGLALLFTAIYQTFRTQLTLFHAICVLHLLSLLGFGLTARGRYGTKGRNRRFVVLASQFLIAGAFLAFAGYIWATAPRFGSQPQCNATTVYVVFGVSIRATEVVFRYVILGLMIATVVGTVVGMACFGAVAVCMCGVRRKDRIVRSDDVAMAGHVLSRIRFEDGKGKSAALQSEIVGVVLWTGVNVYAIITLEQTIQRNDLGPEEREWSFGQVLALFMLAGVAVEVLNIFLAKMDTREKQKDADAEQAAGRPPQIEQQRLTRGTELQARLSTSDRSSSPTVERGNSND